MPPTGSCDTVSHAKSFLPQAVGHARRSLLFFVDRDEDSKGAPIQWHVASRVARGGEPAPARERIRGRCRPRRVPGRATRSDATRPRGGRRVGDGRARHRRVSPVDPALGRGARQRATASPSAGTCRPRRPASRTMTPALGDRRRPGASRAAGHGHQALLRCAEAGVFSRRERFRGERAQRRRRGVRRGVARRAPLEPARARARRAARDRARRRRRATHELRPEALPSRGPAARYQITQQREPVVLGGALDVFVRDDTRRSSVPNASFGSRNRRSRVRLRVERLQLETDTGKSATRCFPTTRLN